MVQPTPAQADRSNPLYVPELMGLTHVASRRPFPIWLASPAAGTRATHYENPFPR